MEKSEIISELSVASIVMRALLQLPGYNGSILMIDDIEAERIGKAIDAALNLLRDEA